MRGSRTKTKFPVFHNGIIPAGAGLTPPVGLPRFLLRDHPRGCGAHQCRVTDHTWMWGSSPRVRGSLNEDLGKWVLDGIIPAGAGLTSELFDATIIARDHPRGCGAHGYRGKATTRSKGSSPRVRGSRCRGILGIGQDGIIPAGAGLTCSRPACHPMCRDHPRGCGAHSSDTSTIWMSLGSSPRVRGSLRWVEPNILPHRIIPAGAGLTALHYDYLLSYRDHPRGCGAHLNAGIQIPINEGSSPRVRGSLTDRRRNDISAGIIPAGAGLTVTSMAFKRT